MNKTFPFLVLLLVTKVAATQTLNKLFLQLPDSCLLPAKESWYKPLDAAGRATLLKNGTYDAYKLIAFDVQNGYLSFLTATDGPGYVVEMTYWKLKSGAKLVGLHIIAASPFARCTKQIFWLKYEDGKWTDLTRQYLSDLQIENFYPPRKAPTDPQMRQMRWYFSLPRLGVNITIYPPEVDDVVPDSPPEAYYEMQWVNERFQLVRKLYEK
jgi:hypothetical protein